MPAETEQIERQATQISKEILRKARTISALEGVPLYEVIERYLGPAVDKRFNEVVKAEG